MTRNTAWIRHGNAVAERYRGCHDAQRVFDALKDAIEMAKAEGVTYMASDEELMKNARTIANGSNFHWR